MRVSLRAPSSLARARRGRVAQAKPPPTTSSSDVARTPLVVKRKPISPSPQNGDSVTIPSDVGVDIGAIGAVLCAETPASDSPCLSTAEIDPTTTSCDNSSSVSAAAAAAATFVVEQDTSLDGWHSDGSFRVAMDPRPNEIDEFGVVNNTCYNVFMNVARYGLFSELGVPTGRRQARGVNRLTVKVSTSFMQPLRLGDDFYATSAIKCVSRSTLVLCESVRKRDGNVVVASSEVTVAAVDDNFEPTSFPEGIMAAYERAAEWCAARAAEGAGGKRGGGGSGERRSGDEACKSSSSSSSSSRK